jgi:NAD(P)-dependent dehydrogenase (short-subunit alcohol dehydrogenase family)
MRRLGSAVETADAIVYLLSDESSYITGVELPVDGGLMA